MIEQSVHLTELENQMILKRIDFNWHGPKKLSVEWRYTPNNVSFNGADLPLSGIILVIGGGAMMLTMFGLRPGIDRLFLGLPLFIIGVAVLIFGVSKIASEMMRASQRDRARVARVIVEDVGGSLRVASEDAEAAESLRALIDDAEGASRGRSLAQSA